MALFNQNERLNVDYLALPLLENEEQTASELELHPLNQRTSDTISTDVSFNVPSDPPERFNTRTERNDLIRICVISILLTIGYIFNFISVINLLGIRRSKWAIVYLVSTGWLFIMCCVMIVITLIGFTTKNKLGFKTSTCKRVFLSCLFLIGICGHIISLILHHSQKKDKPYIIWEFELIYSLLPFYIVILMLLFQKSSERDVKIKMLKLMLFSMVLFITPFLRLLAITNDFKLFSSHLSAVSNDKEIIISSYLALCAATFIVILIHIIYFLKHYNSGLLIKGIIILSLMYNVVVSYNKKPDFDKYESEYKYRIYCYYGITAILYFIYTCEMFIKVPPKWKKDTSVMPHVQQRASYMPVQRDTDEKIKAVIKAFPDFKPCQENADKYFDEIKFDNSSVEESRLKDSIAAIVPFYNEAASEIHATLRSLYHNFEYIKQKRSKYQFTHFNVLLVGDGWFKSDLSTKQYLTKLYNLTDIDDSFKQINQEVIQSKNEEEKENNRNKKKKKQAYTVILQTKHNKPLLINPFNNGEDDMYLKVTTILKIDNRKKANSHEWFLGEYGFGEWVKCDYMYFTDAYSTINKEGLYKMVMHMNKPKNKDVVCTTGRARVYTIEQEIEFSLLLKEKRANILTSDDNKERYYDEEMKNDLERIKFNGWDAEIFFDPRHDKDDKRWFQEDKDSNIFYKIQDIEYDYRLSINAHLRKCQMFEFEALYGTIGAYLLGGFLPVIPGPCGFYRSSYVLNNEVRGWYFEKIHQENTWDDMDLVLGNMKLAEDRILTVTSILNCNEPVRHSLLPEVVFYFDPMPSLAQLMKQRRRWINGSVATIIFVLRKISFASWNVNFFRRIYVLTIWNMQLFMFLVLFLSPPLTFIISFEYGLQTILDWLLIDHGDGAKQSYIATTVLALMIISWVLYLSFIYVAQTPDRKPKKLVSDEIDDYNICCFSCKKKMKKINCLAFDLTINKPISQEEEDKKIKIHFKPKIIKLMLTLSYTFGVLTLMGSLVSFGRLIHALTEPSEIFDNSFNFFVIIIETIFFSQTFILAPIFSRDIKTLKVLLNCGVVYFLYSPFYVIFFFINAIANVHDLSWGTRPDNAKNESEDKNAKYTTYGILIILIITNIIMSFVFQPFTEGTIARVLFFAILSLPAIFQIFFSIIWLIKERFVEIYNAILPKKVDVQYDYGTEFDIKKIN